MSANLSIAKALEVRLAALAPELPTSWENSNFVPETGVAYQAATVLFAEPENPTLGDDFYRQRGYLQVQLRYPANTGKALAFQRAGLLQSWFKRGLTLEVEDLAVVIEKTPEVTNGANYKDRYIVNVRVRFFANIIPNQILIPAQYIPPVPDIEQWAVLDW